MKNLLTAFFILTSLCVFGQNANDKLVQFSGVVYDLDSNSVVPYVTLKNITQKKTYATNYKGYFSFVANKGDSIVFSSIGYKKLTLVIPQSIKDKKFTVVVKMNSDNIILPVVRVFPWASYDEFKQDFLTMRIADDDLAIAKKNLSRKTLSDLSYQLPMSANEVQTMNFNNLHTGLTNKNSFQTNPLLSPTRWAAFLKQISEGKKDKD